MKKSLIPLKLGALMVAAVVITPVAIAATSPSTIAINFTNTNKKIAWGTTVEGSNEWINVIHANSTTFASNSKSLAQWATNGGSTETYTNTVPSMWYTAGDFWQQSLGSNPQPYQYVIGANASSGMSGYGSLIQLTGLQSWMTDHGYTSYEVKVYYASNGATASTVDALVYSGLVATGMTDLSSLTLLGESDTGKSSYAAQEYAAGSLVAANADQLVVAIPTVSGNYGIAGITLTGIPEPSTYALIGAAAAVGLAVIRRRRKA